MMLSEDGQTALAIIDLTTNQTKAANTSNLKVRGIDWSGPNHVLLYASITTNIMEYRSSKVEFWGVFSIDTRDMSKPKQLLANTRDLALQSSLADVRAYVGNDNGDVYMAARMDHGGSISGIEDLLLVNGATGRGREIARGSESTRYWVVSPKGHVIARVDHLQKSDLYRVLVPTDEDRRGTFKAIFREETDLPNITVYGATADEKHLIVSGWKSSDREALFKMSLETGELEEALFEHELVDVLGVHRDPYTGAIVGARFVIHGPEQVFFENDLQAVLQAVLKALPDKTVSLRSWSKDRKKFVAHSQGDDDPGTYYVFDLSAGKMLKVGSARENIKADDIYKVTPFFFKARDGQSIHAFLTVPPGKSPKNIPLVVLPHGGPASRDSTSFDYWAQFLASRGYGVLKVNFRGSTGYGKNFERAGEGEWGGKMQDDVTDGVEHVIKEGIADPTRVCIVGGSYGGYTALAGAAFTPDLYRCAVSIAGSSDLERKMGWASNRFGVHSEVYEYWMKSVGDPATHMDLIRARSPSNSAYLIKADLMLIRGKDDTVVAFEQSEIMAEAMKRAGKDVSFVKLDGEDHWISTATTRTKMLTALESFLAKHLGP
ncbi:MAG: S9 family peptidase [Alphaproteobacteria bacterium]|nr:S9 family peptidase [Alphaproteobacteria bacterium]